MTESQGDINELRRAKEALQGKYGDRPWFRGVGIARTKSGLGLRLNIDPAVKLREGEVPKTFRDYPVEVVFIGSYKPRSG